MRIERDWRGPAWSERGSPWIHADAMAAHIAALADFATVAVHNDDQLRIILQRRGMSIRAAIGRGQVLPQVARWIDADAEVAATMVFGGLSGIVGGLLPAAGQESRDEEETQSEALHEASPEVETLFTIDVVDKPASNILDQSSVKLGPAVAEEAEAGAVAAGGVQVERGADPPV